MKTPDIIFVPDGEDVRENGLYGVWRERDEHDMHYAKYIRMDAIEHIIGSSLGPQEALNKIRSL